MAVAGTRKRDIIHRRARIESKAQMDALHQERLQSLKQCSFLPGSNDKRFIMRATRASLFTDKQKQYLTALAWKYRRQMPAHLVPDAKP